MPRILRRPQAAEDILEVWDYIAEDSLDQADGWVDRLDQAPRIRHRVRVRDLLQPVPEQQPLGRQRHLLAAQRARRRGRPRAAASRCYTCERRG